MACIPFHHDGVSGFVCTSRRSFPKCSTRGCRRRGPLECDHPVEREHTEQPKRGDARVHREKSVVFYVWSVQDGNVTISVTPPGARHAVIQTVPLESWWAKTSATCDRPVCEKCAVRVGRLDFCGPHARHAAKEAAAG